MNKTVKTCVKIHDEVLPCAYFVRFKYFWEGYVNTLLEFCLNKLILDDKLFGSPSIINIKDSHNPISLSCNHWCIFVKIPHSLNLLMYSGAKFPRKILDPPIWGMLYFE